MNILVYCITFPDTAISGGTTSQCPARPDIPLCTSYSMYPEDSSQKVLRHLRQSTVLDMAPEAAGERLQRLGGHYRTEFEVLEFIGLSLALCEKSIGWP
jgi:hypothetical protein